MSEVLSLGSGIYKIINKINGKYYVGSSVNIYRRWICHKSNLRRGVHKTPKLQASWNKHTESNFNFVVIETCFSDKDSLLKTEQKYLDIAKNEQHLCYNTVFFADAPNRGRKYSPEVLKKMSENMKQRYLNGLVNPNKGKKLSLETRRKIRETRIRRQIKPSQKQRDMQSKIVKGKNNYFYGKSLDGDKNARYISTILEFYNTKTQETFRGARHDLIIKYNLSSGNVCSMIKGRIKSVKGWTLIHNPESPQLPQSEASPSGVKF